MIGGVRFNRKGKYLHKLFQTPWSITISERPANPQVTNSNPNLSQTHKPTIALLQKARGKWRISVRNFINASALCTSTGWKRFLFFLLLFEHLHPWYKRKTRFSTTDVYTYINNIYMHIREDVCFIVSCHSANVPHELFMFQIRSLPFL